MPAKTEIKYGLYLGIGFAIAFAIIAYLQTLILKSVRKNGG